MCMQRNQNERPTVREILDLPAVKSWAGKLNFTLKPKIKHSPDRIVFVDEDFPTIKIHSGEKMIKNESQIFTIKDTEEMNKGLNEIEITTSQFLAT